MLYILDKSKKLILLFVTIIIFSSLSVGYGLVSSTLNIDGEAILVVDTSLPIITNVSSATLKNNATETTSVTYTDSSVSMGVNLTKVTSEVIYNITITNEGGTNARFFETTATIGNSAITYTIEGIDTSTILAPDEEVTFSVTIHYTDEYQYTLPDTKSSTLLLEFQFVSTTRSYFSDLTGQITPDSGNVSDYNNGALFEISITNPNDFPVVYSLEGENNFIVYNEAGEIDTYYIDAKTTNTFNIYVKDSDKSVAQGTTSSIDIIATGTDYDVTKTVVLDTVTLTLDNKGKYIILEDGYQEPGDVDYSSPSSSTGGIFVASGLEQGHTYYYRGVVNNNYFDFAGYTWRILRIDENANIRLVLNNLITDSSGNIVTQPFKSSYGATSLEEAIVLLRYVNNKNDASLNSPLYGSVDSTDTTNLYGWYNTYIKSYESYIVDSQFCIDTTGGNATSSGTNSDVYYFGSYQRIGVDTAIYTPEYDCSNGVIITDKVGFLSADEYIFAGGAFRTSNTSFFLNDSGISSSWWTLSPGYYDSSQANVGGFIVESNGSITDWIDQDRITEYGGIRPVLTISGNHKINGDGSSETPYTISE